MKNGVRFLVFLVIVIVIRTQAQEVPKVEVGVQYSAQDIPSSRVGCVGCKVYNNGVGGRCVANFHRALSFDSEFDSFQMRALGIERGRRSCFHGIFRPIIVCGRRPRIGSGLDCKIARTKSNTLRFRDTLIASFKR